MYNVVRTGTTKRPAGRLVFISRFLLA